MEEAVTCNFFTFTVYVLCTTYLACRLATRVASHARKHAPESHTCHWYIRTHTGSQYMYTPHTITHTTCTHTHTTCTHTHAPHMHPHTHTTHALTHTHHTCTHTRTHHMHSHMHTHTHTNDLWVDGVYINCSSDQSKQKGLHEEPQHEECSSEESCRWVLLPPQVSHKGHHQHRECSSPHESCPSHLDLLCSKQPKKGKAKEKQHTVSGL